MARINELIAHPGAIGSFKMSTSSAMLIAKADAHAEVGPLPLLLERKTQILRRISALRQEQGIAEIKEVVTSAKVAGESDEELIQRVEERLSERLEEERSIQRQMAETDEARQKALQFNLNLKKAAVRDVSGLV